MPEAKAVSFYLRRYVKEVSVHRIIFFMMIGLLLSPRMRAEAINKNDSTPLLTLDQCIDYAMKHEPALNQSLINQAIARSTNAINLAGWLPQANLTGTLTHYTELPTSFITNSANPGTGPVKQKTGVVNTAIPGLSVSQSIFSPSLLYAAKSKNLYLKQAEQITDSTKIDIVAAVSKSFYSLLLTLEQITVLKEDTERLSKNLSDTYHQYVGGIVDMTDYLEAGITLNNSKAQLKQANENIIPQYAVLKQVMGYPAGTDFNVSFDTLQMVKDIGFDTTQSLQVEKRIEFQQLQTTKSLQHQLTNYYRLAFLPTLSSFFNYYPEFQSNQASTLFANAYPYSYVGVSLSMPLFTGFSRVQSLHRARLQEQLTDWSVVGLKSQIYTEYTTALANYKGNLYNMNALKDNTAMAKNVYGIITLQYQQGVVAYLNVITAESNLITSEIGYLNALFQVLSSKIDLQKAMGSITYNH